MGIGGVWIVHDFTSGKRAVRGEPNPDLKTWETVTVVRRDRIDDVLSTRDEDERFRVLRRLRDDGLLIVPAKGRRLQHRVRSDSDDGSKFRAYVFACGHPDDALIAATKVLRER